ncbi:helix-turn-helix domain-containing protein [Haloarchaeobius sp. DFWS5]|uniref:helix-turn-helix domain-containing protein n=1 Tax=Haloarchaeobius sp. DFWS5 TaxID=3446114 RepID=UPI003EBF9006
MPKYSTGGSSGSSDGDTCELCGADSNDLRTANVAGASLQVCRSCAPHDDAKKQQSRGNQSSGSSGGSQGQDERSRKRRAVQNAAKANDVWDGDSSRWEAEGTNYDDDPLPYLVKNYGQKLTEARQEKGLQREELAAELGVDEADIIAIEQGRATQAGIGGGLISAIEDQLDIELAES